MMHLNKPASLFTAAAVAMVLSSRPTTAAKCPCTIDPRLVESLSASGPDLEGIDDIFEDWLGEVDNGNAPVAADGFRSINWDGAGIPFHMPDDFFAQAPVDRGLLLKSSTTPGGFVVSDPADGSDRLFDSVNEHVSADFAAFTPERIFTALYDTQFEITFSVPGTGGQDPALVGAFGAIFVDVDLSDTTQLQLYDVDDCLLFEGYVEPSSGGHSFLGFKLPEKNIAKVVVTLGNTPLAGGHESAALESPTRVLRGKGRKGRKGRKDIVVMDDFYYDEPVAQQKW